MAVENRAWPHQHLLDLERLSADEIRHVLSIAQRYESVVKNPDEQCDELRGHCVATLFFEDSTRTRVSFCRAAQLMGADVLELAGKGSSASKGETTIDTALNIEAMGANALVIRHNCSGAPHLVAQRVQIPVINAGDGRHAHPTQGLLDIYSMASHWDSDDFSNRTIAIVGDIANSRVARSNIQGLTSLGARVIAVGPPTLVPHCLESLGIEVSHDLDHVLPDLDAIMMLRMQFERLAGLGIASQSDYRMSYALDRSRREKLPDDALIMHPGPINRGLEISSDVADSKSSIILEQVTHGVAIRMAILKLLMVDAD